MPNQKSTPFNLDYYKKDSKAFCVLPWLHFHSAELGRVKACCVGNIPFGNVNEKSIREIWNDQQIRDFRLKLLKDEAENRCKSCYKREEAGKLSLRQENNAKFSKHLNSILEKTKKDGSYPENPVYWDIRFSNLCNLRCRSCWHGNSSRWFEDAKSLKRNLGEEKLIKHVKEFSHLLEEWESFLPNLEEIYFAGGEPLIMDEHLAILELLVNSKRFDVRLKYNTNFTVLKHKNQRLFEIWNQFDSVEIAASLDDSGQRGEYIRKDLDWDKVLENRKLLKSSCPRLSFHVNPTLSIYNVLNLPDFHKECVANEMIEIPNFKINILERPFHLNIKALPIHLKEKVEEKYKKHLSWVYENMPISEEREFLIQDFQSCINFMKEEDLSKQIQKFRQENLLLDDLRKEKFEKTFPELALELGY